MKKKINSFEAVILDFFFLLYKRIKIIVLASIIGAVIGLLLTQFYKETTLKSIRIIKNPPPNLFGKFEEIKETSSFRKIFEQSFFL